MRVTCTKCKQEMCPVYVCENCDAENINLVNKNIVRLRRIETIAKDVNTWLKQSELRGTAHQRELEKALNE